jgi:putative heme-binding domain-containing protein
LKLGYCSRCHRYEGRGGLVGPDLTRIGQRQDARQHIVTALLQPARDVAPNYRQWQIITKDGKKLAGISLRKGSGSEDYLGADGKPFSVRLADIEERREMTTSIMPEGLLQTLTPQELRDLLAFLVDKS